MSTVCRLVNGRTACTLRSSIGVVRDFGAIHCLPTAKFLMSKNAQFQPFNRIASSPAALRCLITTFSYSRFLSEAVLQHPEWLLQAADPGDLHRYLGIERKHH